MSNLSSKPLPTMPMPDQAGGFYDVAGLATLRREIETSKSQFIALIEGLEGQLHKLIEDAVDQIVGTHGDPKFEEQLRDKTKKAKRKELREGSVDKRGAFVSKAEEYVWNVALSEELWKSPVSAISATTYTKAEVVRYVQMMGNEGPTALRTYAVTAMAFRDVLLGSAVVKVAASRSQKNLTFDYRELAANLIGKQCDTAKAHILAIKAAAKEIKARNEEFYHGRDRDTNNKISSGLMDRKVKAADEAAGLVS